MRIPATAIRGHLMWTRSGTVWATWRMQGLPRGLGNSELNEARRRMHRALMQGVLGEYMILGLNTDISSDDIANRMLEGVNVEHNPAWAEEVLLTAERHDREPLSRRDYWIAAPLKPTGIGGRLHTYERRITQPLRDELGLPPQIPTSQEVQEALSAAARIESALPKVFKPQRATVREQVWIASQAMTRGLYNVDPAPIPVGMPAGSTTGASLREEDGLRTATAKTFPLPWLDEGGQSDTQSRASRLNVLNHRYLKVRSDRHPDASYQVLLALAGGPNGGWEEGLDWVGLIDELGVSADWVFRIRSISARDAKRRNKRSEANLSDQINQQEGTAAITGSGGELDDIQLLLSEYHRELNSSQREVEVQSSLIVAVGGETVDEAKGKASFLQKSFRDNLEFDFDIPLGGQEALWWGMLPGTIHSRAVNEFAEMTTGTHFASLSPMTSSDLGDNRGILLGENITSGSRRPVLIDLWGQIKGDVSGSIGIVGEPGGGKSVIMKIILGSTYDRGDRFVAIDRTKAREYGTFAGSLSSTDSAVADLTEPQYSLDPLRIFGPRVGAGAMLTLCSAILGVPSRSPEGVFLAQLLNQKEAEAKRFTSAGAVMEELDRLRDTAPEASRLLGLMRLYASTEFGEVLFDQSLPPLDLRSRGIVFLTHGVELPSIAEVNNPKQFDQLGPKKIFGYGMYALLTDISKEICFGNKNELAVFAVDELSHVTASPQGTQTMTEFLVDGRKHGAPCLVATQDARQLGDDIGRAMIKNRILTRQTDRSAARTNLEWFHEGFGESEELVDMVTEELSPMGPDGSVPANRRGETLFSDAQGRMGKMRALVPASPIRRAATLSTPEDVASEVS